VPIDQIERFLDQLVQLVHCRMRLGAQDLAEASV
jgi:hypothetical protein